MFTLSSMLIAGLWSGCNNEQDFSGTANITATFTLKSPAAMGGKITLREAYLKLDRIEVMGSLNGSVITNIAHAIPPQEPPFKLIEADSSHVRLSVTSHAYDQLGMRLVLFKDTYALTHLAGKAEEIPEPLEDPSAEQGGEAGEDQDEQSGDSPDEGDHADTGQDPDEGTDTDDADEAAGESDEDKDEEEKDKGDKGKDPKQKDKKKDKKKGHDEKQDDDNEDRNDDDGDERNGRESVTGSSDQAVDLDAFFQNAKPGMVVFGVYENNGNIIQLIFVAAGLEDLTVMGRQNGNSSIRLGENNTARITFDPDYWFQTLMPADIESAMTQTYQQQKVLFIHPEHNTTLYQTLVSRIEESADLTFSLPGSGEGL